MKKLIQRLLCCATVCAVFSTFIACGGGNPSGETPTVPIDPGEGVHNVIDAAEYTQKVDNVLTDSVEDAVDGEVWKNFVTITCGATINVVTEQLKPEEITVTTTDHKIVVSSPKKIVLTLKGALTGNLTVVKPDGKLKLVLDGITINSPSGPAINLQTQKRVFVVVKDGTVNTLSDGAEHPALADGSVTKAAFFSEEQLIFSGQGALNVTGKYKHAIASDDYVKITDGTINVKSAAYDGIHAKDAFIMDCGILNIEGTESDAIECDNGYIAFNGGLTKIVSKGNGIASTYLGVDPLIRSDITFLNGIVKISAEKKGIEGISDIALTNAYITVESAHESLYVGKNLTVSGGFYYLLCAERELISVAAGMEVTGGTLVGYVKTGATYGISCTAGNVSIKKGTVVIGAKAIMAPSEATTSQATVIMGGSEKDVIINLRDKSGSAMVDIKLPYTVETLLISVPQMTIANEYEIYTGGTIQGDEFHGLYVTGSYKGGKIAKQFVADKMVTVVGGATAL